MNPCPNCSQLVMAMSKTCRHCGREIDEETFFLNEADMAKEIAEYQKEVEQKKQLTEGLSKKLKLAIAIALLSLVGGGGLVTYSEFIHDGRLLGLTLGGIAAVLVGVGATFISFKTRQRLEELKSES